jgi:hypothetical protein
MRRKTWLAVFGMLSVALAFGVTAAQPTDLVVVSDQEALAVGGGVAHAPCGNDETAPFTTCAGSNLCAWPLGWYSCPGFQSQVTFSAPGDRINNPALNCVNACGNGCGLAFSTHRCP